jgi:hypothetical protein
MKNKLLLLALALCGSLLAKAYTGDPEPGTPAGGKKSDVMGVVLQSENKKPIKEVLITAYLASKKEKTIQTDNTGAFSFDELKPGTYKFVFEKSGFKKVTKEKVVVKSNEGFQMNIEMIENRDFDLVPSPLIFTDF